MKRLYEADIIRTIAILIVVFAHCFAIYTGSWGHPEENFEIIYSYRVFTRLLSVFMIPTLVLIAGYVFSFISKKREANLWGVITNKFQRLIIPSIVFSIAYIIWRNRDVETLQNIHNVFRGVAHMWYLPMLFWNFIFGYFLIKIKVYKLSSKLLIVLLLYMFGLFIFSAYSPIPNLLGITRALSFTTYFYIGIILYDYREPIVKYLRPWLIFLCFVIFALLFVVNECFLIKAPQIEMNIVFKAISKNLGSLVTFSGVMWFYILVLYLVEYKNIVPSKSFGNLSEKTYGIYLFHQFILIFIIFDLELYKLLDFRIAPFIYFPIALLSSLILTNIFLKLRIGKYLIG